MKLLGPRFILPVFILLYSMNFMDRSVLGVVGDAIKAELGLSDAQLGLLHSILLMMLVVLLLPLSALCDIAGRKRVVTVVAGIWTMAVAWTGLAASFIQLVLARALAGVNEAGVSVGGISWLSSFFPAEKRGRLIGAFQMSTPLGMALGSFLGGAVLALTGSWRLAFLLFVIPGIFCIFAIPRLPDNQKPASKGYFRHLPGLLKSRTLVLCGVGAGLYCIAKFAYQTWLPVLLLRCYPGLSPAMAGAMAGLFLLAGILGPLLGGSFSDWFNRRSASGRAYAIIICLCVVVASKFLLYYMTGRTPLYLLFCYGLVDGVFTMLPLPIYFTMTQDVVADRYRAIACGIMGTVAYLCGGAWGPVLVGYFSDLYGGGAQGLRLAELILLVFPALAMGVFALAIKPYARECARPAGSGDS